MRTRHVKIGTRVTFNPFDGVKTLGLSTINNEVTGKVVEIHAERNWFAVEYELNGNKLRTSFNFVDIGDKVKIVRYVHGRQK